KLILRGKPMNLWRGGAHRALSRARQGRASLRSCNSGGPAVSLSWFARTDVGGRKTSERSKNELNMEVTSRYHTLALVRGPMMISAAVLLCGGTGALGQDLPRSTGDSW